MTGQEYVLSSVELVCKLSLCIDASASVSLDWIR